MTSVSTSSKSPPTDSSPVFRDGMVPAQSGSDSFGEFLKKAESTLPPVAGRIVPTADGSTEEVGSDLLGNPTHGRQSLVASTSSEGRLSGVTGSGAESTPMEGGGDRKRRNDPPAQSAGIPEPIDVVAGNRGPANHTPAISHPMLQKEEIERLVRVVQKSQSGARARLSVRLRMPGGEEAVLDVRLSGRKVEMGQGNRCAPER